MAILHIVRHGRTVLNEQRKTQGAADSPLTAEGREGARVCRDYLADRPLTKAYTSPQGRAVETTGILLEAHPGLEAVRLSGLREYDYGIYDGGPDPEMHKALPADEHLPAVLRGEHPGAPRGNHALDYLADIDAALARILADTEDDDEVLVMSHGMTIMVMLGRWVGLEVFELGALANCSVTTVEVDADGVAHLREWAVDPGNQGVTFPLHDFRGTFTGLVPVPVDLSHPEGL